MKNKISEALNQSGLVLVFSDEDYRDYIENHENVYHFHELFPNDSSRFYLEAYELQQLAYHSLVYGNVVCAYYEGNASDFIDYYNRDVVDNAHEIIQIKDGQFYYMKSRNKFNK